MATPLKPLEPASTLVAPTHAKALDPKAVRPRTFEAAKTGALEAWLRSAIGDGALTIAEAALLSGGAVQENWRLRVTADGQPDRHWVLRTDASQRLSLSLDRAAEFQVIEAAFATGVPVGRGSTTRWCVAPVRGSAAPHSPSARRPATQPPADHPP